MRVRLCLRVVYDVECKGVVVVKGGEGAGGMRSWTDEKDGREREGEETQRVSLLRRQAPIEPETPRESQHTRIPHLLNTISASLPAVIRSSSLGGTTWRGCFEWCGQLKRQPVRNRSSLPEFRVTLVRYIRLLRHSVPSLSVPHRRRLAYSNAKLAIISSS